MKNWKNWIFLPAWLMVILALISTAVLTWVFMEGMEEHPIAYVGYLLSFYSLTVICIAIYKWLPGHYKCMKEKMYANPYAGRYLTDVEYKTHISLYLSLGINFLYLNP